MGWNSESTAHLGNDGASWGSDTDDAWIVGGATFNLVSLRQESVEALDKLWVASEQSRDAPNDARGIDAMEE